MFHPSSAFSFLSLATCLSLAAASGMAQETSAKIAEGKQVSFAYTLTSEGEVIEGNTAEDPMVYIQGSGRILQALETQLEGLSAGDEKVITLAAADAYGEIKESAFQEVPLDQLPEDARVAGTLLKAQGFPGPIRVAEVRDDVAILDFNHPLAGKDVTFDIVIVAVEDAPPAPAPAAPVIVPAPAPAPAD